MTTIDFLDNKNFSTDSCGLFYLANSRATLFTLRCQLITKYLKQMHFTCCPAKAFATRNYPPSPPPFSRSLPF